MYKHGLIASIKVDGKVLQELDEQVYLPFGSEYSIKLENLTDKKAKIWVTIDSTEAATLVLYPGQNLELERFIKKDLLKGNKFKFIPLTDQIKAHRGTTERDGLVVVKWQYALPTSFYHSGAYNIKIPAVSSLGPNIALLSSQLCTNFTTTNIAATTKGITVPGSESNQQFSVAGDFATATETHTMVFSLVGAVEDKPVEQPLNTKQKNRCSTCGKVNKLTAKFCSECGTSLVLFS